MSLLVVDTSIWIDLFSGRHPEYSSSLMSDRVHIHEFIVGELLMGAIPRNDPRRELVSFAPRVATLAHDHVVEFVSRFRLEGSGVGWLDAHVLASAWSVGAQLWTTDSSLLRAAGRAGVHVWAAAGRLPRR